MGDIARGPPSGLKYDWKKGGQARLNFFTIWLDCPPGDKQQELPYRIIFEDILKATGQMAFMRLSAHFD